MFSEDLPGRALLEFDTAAPFSRTKCVTTTLQDPKWTFRKFI